MHSSSLAVIIGTALLTVGCGGGEVRTPGAPTPPVVTPAPAPTGPPAAMTIASGNDQHGKAGEPLGEPFVVRVTDKEGKGVNDVAVFFELATGAGELGGGCGYPTPTHAASVRTNPEGLVQMKFRPTELGQSTVTARIAEEPRASATFVVEAPLLVIEFWFGAWGAGFVGPCSGSSQVNVPVGTTVEWKVFSEEFAGEYTVTSKSTPPGGKDFDSGTLTAQDRFRFIPDVKGTWEYYDKATGLAGALTAK
jgi:hypothetical protein